MADRTLAERIREQRRFWFELDTPPRRALRLERPQPADLIGAKLTEPRALMAFARKQVVGWRNFTEADLLGAGIGSSDDLAFDADACDEWLGEQPDVLLAIANVIVDKLNAASETKKAEAGNSAASSTTSPASSTRAKPRP